MGTTPIYGLPYPDLDDAPNVPADVQALAEATETELDRLPVTVQTFTANGTWNKPAFAKAVRVQVQAGGGAGGGCATTAAGESAAGGGGEGGAYVESWFAASALGASEQVTRGAGGTGVTNGDGNPGGTSSFGVGASLVSAAGGAGGSVNVASSSSPGGGVGGGSTQAMTGGLQIAGAPGFFGRRSGSSFGSFGGNGGGSYLGQGGQGGTGSGNGNAGRGYGGGGGGGINNTGQGTARAGGAGAGGRVIVTTYY